MDQAKKKACLLVNMISPARIPLYSTLADHFDLLVVHGGTEANRKSWQAAEVALTNARVKRAWGWQFAKAREHEGAIIERRSIHITPGYAQALLKCRPDVIITNEMGFRTLVALVYGFLFRTPVWVWWGGTLHTERNAGVARKSLRWLISRWARRWISYGKSSTTYLKSLGIGQGRILELQNGVDEKRFTKSSEQEFQIHPRPVVLHVGQLIPRKGIDLLLRAAADLQREGLEFSILLVGSGPDEFALKRLACELNLRNVHFRPEVAPKRMPAVYRSADVLVFSTIEDVWGLVANEAILSDLPVLCSQYAGCAEELFPPENVFDPHNPEEFVQKLRAALAGQLAAPDPSRLRTTAQLAGELIRALDSSISGSAGKSTGSIPAYGSTKGARWSNENLSRP